MLYKENKYILARDIADLRESVGLERLEESYRNGLMKSYFHIGAFDGEKLVGYIDTVSNGVTQAYIQDLMVHPDYQRQGIGTNLVKMTIKYLKKNSIYKVAVVYDEQLRPFYQRFGFDEIFCGQKKISDLDLDLP